MPADLPVAAHPQCLPCKKVIFFTSFEYERPSVDPRELDYGDLIAITYTVKFWQDGFVYLTDSSNYYYRVDVNALLTTPSNKVEPATVTLLADSAWYTPEVLNGYFFSVYSAEPYTALVFASDIAANGALTEEQIAEIREVSEEQINVNLGHSISFKSEATKEAIETYLEENFKDEE